MNKHKIYIDLHVESLQSLKLYLLQGSKALVLASQKSALSAQPVEIFHGNQEGPFNSRYMSFNRSIL